jgi:hypothetical protein
MVSAPTQNVHERQSAATTPTQLRRYTSHYTTTTTHSSNPLTQKAYSVLKAS